MCVSREKRMVVQSTPGVFQGAPVPGHLETEISFFLKQQLQLINLSQINGVYAIFCITFYVSCMHAICVWITELFFRMAENGKSVSRCPGLP